MQISVGIVGLPNVGKSTLFNALTKKSVPAENYPFCTIDPSVGVVPVPDPRLDALARFSGSKKVLPAVIEFVDIAGLVKGASKGEGLGNAFLANIREVDAILHLVRLFDDPNIIHVHGDVDPASDVEVITLELVMADLQTVTKRLQNIERDVKRGDKQAVLEKAVLERVAALLEAGKPARLVSLSDEERPIVNTMHLLTMKQVVYGLNRAQGKAILDTDPRYQKLMTLIESEGAPFVFIDAGVARDLSTLSDEEKEMFKDELGGDTGIDDLITSCFEALGLMTYMTTGPEETRAWTIARGSSAPEAGMAIHTDFKERFIKAEAINWEELIAAGSWGKAREQGLVRTEGKEYVVREGDVLEFKVGA